MHTELGLGQLIADPAAARRDAIHVAVYPATAGDKLRAGDRVFLAGGVAVRGADNSHGIVDPFLTAPVPRGAAFWVFLFPGTVTGLRHAWTHPGIPDEAPAAPPEPDPEPDQPGTRPPWRTSNTVAMCQRLIAEHWKLYDELLPVLADALQDEGFPDALTLDLCRRKRDGDAAARVIAQVMMDDGMDMVAWIDQFALELNKTYSQLMSAAESYLQRDDYVYDNSEDYKEADYDKWPVFWRYYARITGFEVTTTTCPYTCSC